VKNQFNPSQIISLRIEAPFACHDQITQLLRVGEEFADKIGPPLAVRMRKLNEGVGPRKEIWSIVLFESEDIDIEQGIKFALNWFVDRKPSLNVVEGKVGEIGLYASIWSSEKVGFVLPKTLMAEMSEAGISMSFDLSFERE
jgi:hypothetical protein